MDPKKQEVVEETVEFEVEGEPSVEVEKPAAKAADEADIEIVDDTPPQDRGRRPMTEPPKDPTDEELAKYDDSVKKRIQHFTRGYHEERRAKEAAMREKEEAIRLAQAILEENNRLKGTLGTNQQALIEQAKKVVANEVEQAKRKYKEAYESGDADALATAQAELTAATVKMDRVNSVRPPAPKRPEQEQPQPAAFVPPPAPAPAPDERALQWQAENRWFGQDQEMTSFAIGLHTKMVSEGVDPRSDEYYSRLNTRLRQVFPDQFSSDEPADAGTSQRKTKPTNVAPASRSTAPKKIVLTQTQVQLAKRLGVPLELYARKVAEEMRK